MPRSAYVQRRLAEINQAPSGPKRLNSVATPWLDWIGSEEGRKCADIESLRGTDAKYLANRLWYAFQAGVAAGESSSRRDGEKHGI